MFKNWRISLCYDNLTKFYTGMPRPERPTVSCSYTPNCNNVVLEKWRKEKAKWELNRLIKPHSHGRFICSRCISTLELSVLLSFSFKTIANSNRQIRCPCADAANKFIRLISLINSYFAFSFLSFFYGNVFAVRCICHSVLRYPFRILSTDELYVFHVPSLKHYFLLVTVNALSVKKYKKSLNHEVLLTFS